MRQRRVQGPHYQRGHAPISPVLVVAIGCVMAAVGVALIAGGVWLVWHGVLIAWDAK